MPNQEEQFEEQLAEEKAKDRKLPAKEKAKPKAPAFLRKNPIIKLLIPSLAEIGSGGLLPGNIGLVVWAYIDEKKAGKTPNIAEYLIVGVPAGVVDSINLLGLTGVLSIFSSSISIPCLALLWFWRLNKGIKKPLETKGKTKT